MRKIEIKWYDRYRGLSNRCTNITISHRDNDWSLECSRGTISDKGRRLIGQSMLILSRSLFRSNWHSRIAKHILEICTKWFEGRWSPRRPGCSTCAPNLFFRNARVNEKTAIPVTKRQEIFREKNVINDRVFLDNR